MTASLACIAVVFAYSSPLLVAMGQDPKLSDLAGTFKEAFVILQYHLL